jgi:hypothetical protein
MSSASEMTAVRAEFGTIVARLARNFDDAEARQELQALTDGLEPRMVAAGAVIDDWDSDPVARRLIDQVRQFRSAVAEFFEADATDPTYVLSKLRRTAEAVLDRITSLLETGFVNDRMRTAEADRMGGRKTMAAHDYDYEPDQHTWETEGGAGLGPRQEH